MNKKARSENDRHFQSFFFLFLISPEENSKTKKVNQQSALKL